MKLLLDMNLSRLWLEPLQEAGFEVVHWSSVGAAYAEDAEIMHYAQKHGYTICTQDLDFGLHLATTGHGKPSVVQIRAQDVLPQDIGPQVILALLQMEPELETGALVTVDPKKTRCGVCRGEYGANGCDIPARLCPLCQQGKAGEVLREAALGLFG